MRFDLTRLDPGVVSNAGIIGERGSRQNLYLTHHCRISIATMDFKDLLPERACQYLISCMSVGRPRPVFCPASSCSHQVRRVERRRQQRRQAIHDTHADFRNAYSAQNGCPDRLCGSVYISVTPLRRFGILLLSREGALLW